MAVPKGAHVAKNSSSSPFHGHAPAANEWQDHFLLRTFPDLKTEGGDERKAALESAKRYLEAKLSRIDAELKELS